MDKKKDFLEPVMRSFSAALAKALSKRGKEIKEGFYGNFKEGTFKVEFSNGKIVRDTYDTEIVIIGAEITWEIDPVALVKVLNNYTTEQLNGHSSKFVKELFDEINATPNEDLSANITITGQRCDFNYLYDLVSIQDLKKHLFIGYKFGLDFKAVYQY